MTVGITEVEALLAVPYSGPTKQVPGSGGKKYTYIPWNITRDEFDRIFGAMGWSNRVVQIESHPEQGVYTAAVEISVYVKDEDGNIRIITKAAEGRAVAMASADEIERTGNPVAINLKTHDTAASAAGTDGFSKAAKMFGPALGSDLYDKGGATTGGYQQERTASTSAPRQASSGGNLGPRPSDKQQFHLTKAGFDAARVAEMPFNEWKAELDTYFAAKDQKPVLAAVKTPADYGDDNDF